MELLKRMKIHTQNGRTYRISLYWRGCAYLVQKDQPWTKWDYPWENNNGWRMVMMLSEPGLHAAIKEYYRMAKSCLICVEINHKDNWIPVSERLPENNEAVNITYVNHDPESYYSSVKDKPFTATGVYFSGSWYWWSSTVQDYLDEYGRFEPCKIDEAVEILAWQPLPKPYHAEGEERKAHQI